MKKPLDRISEAYFGELGEPFAEKVRNRVHWVCANAKGETILDVGCSQGITAILLAREGKKVVGIDLLEESIEYAKQMLSTEEETTKKYVDFKAGNFMDADFAGQTFDSIIFGEILEHITDPQRFINKAATLLNANGSIIVTLPFGINDYFDHKKTYYLQDLLKFQNQNVVVEELKFLGKWIGAILRKSGDENHFMSVNENLISRLEDSFYIVEIDLIQQIRTRGQKIKNLEEKVKVLTSEKARNVSITNNQLEQKNIELISLRDQLDDKNRELLFVKEQLEERNRELLSFKEQREEKNKQIETIQMQLNLKDQELKTIQMQDIKKVQEIEANMKKKLEEIKKQAINAKKEKINAQEDLYKAYEKEEMLLKSYQKLLRKYTALSDSKLGRLTLTYWRKKRKVFGGK